MEDAKGRLLAYAEGREAGEVPVEALLAEISDPQTRAAVLEEAVLLAFSRKKELLVDRFLEIWLEQEFPLGRWVELHEKVGWQKYWPRTVGGRLKRFLQTDPSRAAGFFFRLLKEPSCREGIRKHLEEFLLWFPAVQVLEILVRMAREGVGTDLQHECFRILLRHPQYPRFDPVRKAEWLRRIESAGPAGGLRDHVRVLRLCAGGEDPAAFRFGEEEAAWLKEWAGQAGSDEDLPGVFAELAMALRRSAADPGEWKAGFLRFAAFLWEIGESRIPYLLRALSGFSRQDRLRWVAEVISWRLQKASKESDLGELVELADVFDYEECRGILGRVIQGMLSPEVSLRTDLLPGWVRLVEDFLMDKGGPGRQLLVSRQVRDLLEPLERRLDRRA